MKDKRGEVRTFWGIVVLLFIVIIKMSLFENSPDVYQQKITFEQSVNQLNFYEFKEKRRDFINKITYQVYYELSGALKEESEENIEKIIVKKFKNAGWTKKSVIDKHEDSKIINFVKKDEKYYCEVEIYKKGVALRFRYK